MHVDKPQNDYPNIINQIQADLADPSTLISPLSHFRMIRAKSGVYVYRCQYGDTPAIAKYFEKADDRREILNYRILTAHNIPTIKPLALGNATIVLEDITASDKWRLGVAEDFNDPDVAKGLARWYFTFHENGTTVPDLDSLYFEYDRITPANLDMMIQKLPEAAELFQFIKANLSKLHQLIYTPSFTLTYNDFHWSNFVVRKDKTAAKMFDYNLLGRGYRFSDFRNVCWGISDEAKAAFIGEYNRLYETKHGTTRDNADATEKQIDTVTAPVFTLLVALLDNEHFPSWAVHEKNEAINGNLLAKVKELAAFRPRKDA